MQKLASAYRLELLLISFELDNDNSSALQRRNRTPGKPCGQYLSVFAAMAMKVALLRMLPNRPLLSCFSYALVFAISTPVGVAIGIMIDATAEGAFADWVYAVSMGLASGVCVCCDQQSA